MNEQPQSKFWPIYLTVIVVACLGCIPENNAVEPGGGTVSGTVGGQTFEVASGSAESSGVDDTFVVTLADTPEFDCSSSSGLPMDYLQVVIGEIDGPTTFSADGRVFFNIYEGGVSAGEAADTGTVTIDEVDEIGGVISGSVDAAGPESSVSGSFSVEICN